MSDPNTPFTAGERPAPPRRDNEPRKPAKPPHRKRPGVLGSILRFLVFGLYRVVFLGLVLGILVGGGGFLYFSQGLPSVESLKTYRPPLESRVFASDFQLVEAVGSQHSIYVTYDQIPPIVSAAFISTEDRLFWSEPGINPLAMVRAGITDINLIMHGQRPQGASTIAQQVVKNMLLDNHITYGTKIKEALLAMRVSQVMSKPQILTLYLNEVDLGHNSFGIAAAAQTYFDKPLDQLDLAQAAMLASLPKGPTNYDPFLHPAAALQRRNFVLSRMLDDGVITQAQASAAAAEPLLPRFGAMNQGVPDSGYFADAVQNFLTQKFGADAVNTGGLVVHTSLDPALQDAATNAVRDGLEHYDRTYDGWHGLVAHVDDDALASNWQKDLGKQAVPPGMRADQGWRLGIVITAAGKAASLGTTDPATGALETGTMPVENMKWARPVSNGALGPKPSDVSQVLTAGDIVMVSGPANALALEQIPNLQGALISMDPTTGRVLAMVGGWSHDVSPFNRAIQAQRQPGSSVKPLVYLTGLEQGVQPDAPELDGPFVVQMADGTVYRPGNYEMTFEGPVPLFHALEHSLNLATLHLAQQIGLDKIASTFQGFGIVDQMPPYYPSAIGAIDTTLWKMTTAYAALDQYGRQITPSLIDSVVGPDGTVMYQSPNQVCDNCQNADPTDMPQVDLSGAQLADPNSVFQIITMMKGVVERGTGAPAVVGITQPVAGKTGTTNNFADAWFIGFTPGIVTGCWIGFDTPANLGNDETGGNVCGPIWNAYMKVALAGQPALDWAAPQGMSLQQVAEPDGTMVTEAFKPGQTPGAQSQNSLLGGGQSTPGTTTPNAPAQPSDVDKSLGGLY
jgi:penicillin-binding protein 1A